MWALGMSLFEIVAGRHPFSNLSTFQIMVTIRTWTPILPTNRNLPDEMKGLILALYVICESSI